MRTLAVIAACCTLLAPALAQDALADAKKECAEIDKEIDAAFSAYQAEFAKVRETDEYKEALARYRENQDEDALETLRRMGRSVKRPEMATYAPRFAVGAVKHSGSDAAVPYLQWLMRRGGKELSRGAVNTIIANHAASHELGEVAEGIYRMGRSIGRDKARALATAIIESNDDAVILAAAHFGRASNYGVLEGRKVVFAEGEAALRDADLATCVKLAPGSISAMRAEGPEFEKERLQIGMESPDIVGKDIDGAEFKLSDYRGKVVVVDFWGDW